MLKTLCDLNGTSGNEAAVRDYILEQIQPYCTTCTVDAMGSVIAFKKGKRTPEKRVILSAHMDEVGLIVTRVTDEGFCKFDFVGGVDRRVAIVTDSGVPAQYAQRVADQCKDAAIITVPQGEASKSFKILETVLRQMLDAIHQALK